MVRRKYERGQLNEGELSQVSGMGQNPMRLFDSPHPKYLNKDETAFHPFDEVEVLSAHR